MEKDNILRTKHANCCRKVLFQRSIIIIENSLVSFIQNTSCYNNDYEFNRTLMS